MPLILTRKQSMWLGLGLLGSFFVISGYIIYQRNQTRIPTQPGSLTKEMVEGVSTPSTAPLLEGAATPGAIGFVLNEFHRSLVRDGKTLWEIVGKRGSYDAAASKALIEEPNLTVTRENGEKVNVVAKRAELALSGSELASADLMDNVVITYRGDTTIKTSRAIYDQKAGRVDVPVPVELDSPMFFVKGSKLVAFIETQEITITNKVHSIIKPRKK